MSQSEEALKAIAGNDKNLLRPLDSIPDPPAELDKKGSEYYYRICDLLLRKNGINKVKSICAANLANETRKAETDPFYFEPYEMNQNEVEKIIHQMAELRILEKTHRQVAFTIGLTLEEIEKAGVPLLSTMQKEAMKRYGKN